MLFCLQEDPYGKDKRGMTKNTIPFEFVVLEACLEEVISSLENEVCIFRFNYKQILFLFFFFEILYKQVTITPPLLMIISKKY